MAQHILIGEGRDIVRTPEADWRSEVEAVTRKRSPRLAFMSKEHHAVRDTVVVEVARRGRALAPGTVAELTRLPEARVATILDELEARLFFLVRNERGEVSWAFPVTSEKTPHLLTFSSGEKVHAA